MYLQSPPEAQHLKNVHSNVLPDWGWGVGRESRGDNFIQLKNRGNKQGGIQGSNIFKKTISYVTASFGQSYSENHTKSLRKLKTPNNEKS